MEKPITVLHFVGSAGTGGVESFALDLARHIDRKRFRLAMCVLGTGGPLVDELRALGWEVRLLGLTGRWSLRAAIECFCIVRATQPGIVHSNVGGAFLRYLCRAAGCARVFSHFHGPADDWFAERRRGNTCLAMRVRRAYIDGATHLLTNSQAGLRTLAMTRSPLGRHATVVPCGVDVTRFRPAPPAPVDAASLRCELGIPAGAPVIGFVGRFVRQKGIPYLLAAMASILNRPTPPCLVLVGDGPLRPELTALARGISSRNILFVEERRDIPRWMGLFDLLVVPSEWEAFGIVSLEAMACGRPVVAFAIDGLPEVVVHNQTGLLVPHRDVARLAEAIMYLLDHPQERRRMGEAGRLRAEADFNAVDMTRTIEALYLRAVEPRGQPLRNGPK